MAVKRFVAFTLQSRFARPKLHSTILLEALISRAEEGTAAQIERYQRLCLDEGLAVRDLLRLGVLPVALLVPGTLR